MYRDFLTLTVLTSGRKQPKSNKLQFFKDADFTVLVQKVKNTTMSHWCCYKKIRFLMALLFCLVMLQPGHCAGSQADCDGLSQTVCEQTANCYWVELAVAQQCQYVDLNDLKSTNPWCIVL